MPDQQAERETSNMMGLQAAWQQYDDIRWDATYDGAVEDARAAVERIASAAGRAELEAALRVFESAIYWIERICDKYDPDDTEDWRQQLAEYRATLTRAALNENTEAGSQAAGR